METPWSTFMCALFHILRPILDMHCWMQLCRCNCIAFMESPVISVCTGRTMHMQWRMQCIFPPCCHANTHVCTKSLFAAQTAGLAHLMCKGTRLCITCRGTQKTCLVWCICGGFANISAYIIHIYYKYITTYIILCVWIVENSIFVDFHCKKQLILHLFPLL